MAALARIIRGPVNGSSPPAPFELTKSRVIVNYLWFKDADEWRVHARGLTQPHGHAILGHRNADPPVSRIELVRAKKSPCIRHCVVTVGVPSSTRANQ